MAYCRLRENVLADPTRSASRPAEETNVTDRSHVDARRIIVTGGVTGLDIVVDRWFLATTTGRANLSGSGR
jgi:hypothetical protein